MDGLKQMEAQLGWVDQVLGQDFWTQVRAGIQGGRPAHPPVPGAPAGAGGARPAAPAAGQGARQGQAPGGPPPGLPPADLWLTPTEVVASIALPGLAQPGQISVSLAGADQALLEAALEPRPALGIPVRQERPRGLCVRILPLPAPVEPGAVLARYADGVLELRFRRRTPDPATGISLLQVPGGEVRT